MQAHGSKRKKDDAQTVIPTYKEHAVWHGDSTRMDFKGKFDLVLCSPPYFHPSKTSSVHGAGSQIRDLELFAEWTAQILVRASKALKIGQPLCFVKTDVRHKTTILPIGFRIAERCEMLGLPIQAHWIWQRLRHFSPYSPSLANIFILGHASRPLLRHAGLFHTSDCVSRKVPTSFTPDLFHQLIRQLTRVNDVVLDPFLGIGSTILAASQCQRWAVGVELSREQILRAKDMLHSVRNVYFRSARGGCGRY
jgi:DNA modification methylase